MKAFQIAALVSVALFTFAGCAADAGDDDDNNGEELSDYTSSSIVGGTVDSGHDAVVYITFLNDGRGAACTGTLIAPTLVLTAAHCVVPAPTTKKVSDWKVFFANDPKSIQAATPIVVASAHAHPAYKHNNFGNGNDAAVLVLSKAAPANIKPIVANARPIGANAVGKSILAVGFGLTDGVNKTGAGTKRQGLLPVAQVRGLEIAAGKPGLTTCQGDSGGPWFAKVNGADTVIGITSYGPAGCVDAASATRVDKVIDFINPFLAKAGAGGSKPAPAPSPAPAPPAENPNPAPAGALASGQVVKGTVSTETDTFKFNAQQARLRFESESAQLIISSSRGGRTVSSGRATVVIGGPADFTIEVRSPGGAAQAYTLTREAAQ